MKILTLFCIYRFNLLSGSTNRFYKQCSINQLIKPVNAKKSQHFYFLNPRKVLSALILGNWENPPLPSDLKTPLVF